MKYNPFDRKQAILTRLNQIGRLSPDSLAEEFGVSVMTINRDVRELAAEGKIRRMHGVILPPDDETISNDCELCRREISERTNFLYLFSTGKTAAYCCPHCGLAQLNANSSATAVFATDFLFGTLIDAYSAVYLVNSRINLCCSPSILCFQNRPDALDFQKGFGGEVYSLKGAVEALFRPNSE